MTNTHTQTPLGGATPEAAGSMEWTAVSAAVKLANRALATTAGAALVGHAAALPPWYPTSEATICAMEGALLLGAAFLRRRGAGARRFSGCPSFRPGELAPGELPRSRDDC